MKVIIVGGVAGGATAAARLRRLNEDAEIIILERSGYISYANCGLPYYIGGKIMDRGELTLQTPESFFERFRINVRTGHEAVSIDKDAKTVTVRKRKAGNSMPKATINSYFLREQSLWCLICRERTERTFLLEDS